MRFGQKIAYMALGGVLVLGGHVVPDLLVGSATAQGGLQDAEFGHLTVESLTVKDAATGMSVVDLGSLAGGYGRVAVHGPASRDVVWMLARPTGGDISVQGADGTTTARIWSVDAGGVVTVSHADGRPAVGMLASADGGEAVGGQLEVYQPDGTMAATVQAYDEGGVVAVYQDDGATAAGMVASPGGAGRLEVYAPAGVGSGQGAPVAITVDEYGGRVDIGSVQAKSAMVSLGVDHNGGRLDVHEQGFPGARASVSISDGGSGSVRAWDESGDRVD